MKRYIILFTIAFLLSSLLHARQELRFPFHQYFPSDGLLSRQCYSVVQDSSGFLWIANGEGLQRYDGYRFKTFDILLWRKHGVMSQGIRQLLYTNNDKLWILFDGGETGILNTRTFTFQRIGVQPRDPASNSSAIKKLKRGPGGQVFLLHGAHEVMGYNESREAFVSRHLFLPLLFPYQVADFEWQPGTPNYYIMVQGGGFMVYNDSTRQLSYKGLNAGGYGLIDALPEDAHPYDLFFDSQQRAWYFHWGPGVPYLNCFDLRTNRYILQNKLLPQVGGYYELLGMFEHSNGDLWVYGAPVLGRINPRTMDVDLVASKKNLRNGIYYEVISQICEDREKNLWIPTHTTGLYRFNPATAAFRTVEHLNAKGDAPGKGAVMDFLLDTDSTLIVSTWGDGLQRYDKNYNQIQVDPSFQTQVRHSVWSMRRGREANTVWMGAQPGIFKTNLATRQTEYFNPPALEDRTVRQILEDRDGTVWLGMQHSGLHKWIPGMARNSFNDGITPIFGLPRMSVNRIIQDSEGLIWIAYGRAGLYAIDPNTNKIRFHFSQRSIPPFRVPAPAVADVMELDSNRMVFINGNLPMIFNKRNLTLRRGGKWPLRGYGASLNKDSMGRVMMTTTAGIYAFDLEKKISLEFKDLDGIENERFILASSGKGPNGELVFGSSEEFLVVKPEVLLSGEGLPDVTITDILVGDIPFNADSVLEYGKVRIRAGDESLVLRFSPLRFSRDFGVFYKLNGFDKEWRPSTDLMQAQYNYLPSGKYSLQFMVVNAAGQLKIQSVDLTFDVLPPFYKRWWFLLLCALLITAIVFYTDKARRQRRDHILNMRSGIARNLHRDVNNGLQNINILSEIARMKADSDPAKTSDYIQLIKDKSTDMMRAMDDMLWSIDPSNDTMVRTLQRMQEILDTLNQKHGVVFDLLVDPRVRELTLNMQLRHEAFILFRECVQGIVSCGANNCNIHLGNERNLLLMNIQFSNANCDIHQLNNLFQRQDMAARLKAIRATLHVNYHKTISNFNITIPVVAA